METRGSSFIAYDGDKFREGQGMVRQAAQELDKVGLSTEQEEVIRRLLARVVNGAIQASEAIYVPPTDPEELERIGRAGAGGSASDLVTDRDNLRTLSRFFD